MRSSEKTRFCALKKMAPGALSILAPFLGRGKAKKYEKLETDDPERRRQEATQEEINRLNCKIVSRGDCSFIVRVNHTRLV